MKTLYIDMDNVLVNFQSGIDRLEKDIVSQHEGRLDEVPGHIFPNGAQSGCCRSLW